MTATYLDYNATAPLRPEARDAMVAGLDAGGNPSSVHSAGRRARAVVERCRRVVAHHFNVASERVTFVSGATEGNAVVLSNGWTTVLVGATEHDSVAGWATGAEAVLPVGADGVLKLDALSRRLDALKNPGSTIVSVMGVNNETGVINPTGQIGACCRAAGVRYHCDATQAVGRLALPEAVEGADIVTVSGHKFGAPPGVGAIIDISGLAPTALTRGGGQEGGRRPGTENAPAIAAFSVALTAALEDWESGRASEIESLRDRAVMEIRAEVPDVDVAGEKAPRVGNTLCIAMAGVPSETQVMALDLDGIAVSAGSACSSGKVRTSPVLTAMGYDSDHAGTFIRVSLGWKTTEDDINRFIAAWLRLYRRLGAHR